MTIEPQKPGLTDLQKAEVFGVLSAGCDREAAADYIGCSLADLQSVLRNDAEFLTRVRRTEASAEVTHMQAIVAFAREKKDWKASVWWLERRSPERYGRRTPGVITERQLKSFISVVGEVIRDVASTDDRQRVIAKLQNLAEAIHDTLRDTTFDVAGLLTDDGSRSAADAIDAIDDAQSEGSAALFDSLT